ncbi:methyltransferase [Neiella sp. HB171785]|uniref:tRNA1(Val) (adenine(37)-N6)-methyltransferase n=1 Tax=Neiella litorisoli TaxID=2771431 RepID=A0A8J6UG13_9GAMM|nr:methyltransferase [Neiella litorisoli]MBD1391394.1 methyltransferase [Neiella litorisoli]
MSGFQCKQFYVGHDRCGMKVGTDSLLLGSWVDLAGVQRVLDVGTGSGILALMMAQRLADARASGFQVDGVEIEPDAAEQAMANFAASPWHHSLMVHKADIHQWQPPQLYDLVISNPPYFSAGQQLDCDKRQQARLQQSLSIGALLELAAGMVHSKAKIALVLPMEKADEVALGAASMGWFIAQQLAIQGRADKPAKRVLLLLQQGTGETEYRSLTIYDQNNQYSQSFKHLTKAFYLAF